MRDDHYLVPAIWRYSPAHLQNLYVQAEMSLQLESQLGKTMFLETIKIFGSRMNEQDLQSRWPLAAPSAAGRLSEVTLHYILGRVVFSNDVMFG